MRDKICKTCFREFEEGRMFNDDTCWTCKDIIGKGAGYKDMVDKKKSEEWFLDTEERRLKLIREGKII